jgi:tRNA(fMet)-specific endonuclease VapC
MYVLDTNILIYFFKGLGNVSQHLLAQSPGNIGIPTIVLYELEVGINKSQSPQKRLKQLNDLISVVTVLPFGHTEAKASAQIRAQLEKKGAPIGPYDILIGGTALGNQAILVTHNLKEFKRIENLNVVDWY